MRFVAPAVLAPDLAQLRLVDRVAKAGYIELLPEVPPSRRLDRLDLLRGRAAATAGSGTEAGRAGVDGGNWSGSTLPFGPAPASGRLV